jgi:hypothetical protein
VSGSQTARRPLSRPGSRSGGGSQTARRPSSRSGGGGGRRRRRRRSLQGAEVPARRVTQSTPWRCLYAPADANLQPHTAVAGPSRKLQFPYERFDAELVCAGVLARAEFCGFWLAIDSLTYSSPSSIIASSLSPLLIPPSLHHHYRHRHSLSARSSWDKGYMLTCART